MKTCSKCMVTKGPHGFHARSSSPDGLHYHCKDCRRSETSGYRERNLEKVEATRQKWVEANPNYGKEYRVRKKDFVKSLQGDWNERNKERRRELREQWARANAAHINAKNAYRKAAKKMATPQWANLTAIVALYREAHRQTRETGIQHHVDHIVPLSNGLVCGLHVEHNLRVIPGADNIAKSNRTWPDMPQ